MKTQTLNTYLLLENSSGSFLLLLIEGLLINGLLIGLALPLSYVNEVTKLCHLLTLPLVKTASSATWASNFYTTGLTSCIWMIYWMNHFITYKVYNDYRQCMMQQLMIDTAIINTLHTRTVSVSGSVFMAEINHRAFIQL